jgi:hypothetical protein
MSETLPQIRVISKSMRATAWFLTGDWQDGEELVRELEDEGIPRGASLLLEDALRFMVRAQQGALAEHLGRLELFEAGAKGWEMWPTWRLGLMLAKAQAGQIDEVKEKIAEMGYDGLDDTKDFNNTLLPFCAVGNLLAGELGDLAGAAKLVELLSPYSGEWIMIGRIGSTLGPVDMHLGELHLLAGEHREAATALERALVTCEAMDSVPYLARTRLALAAAFEEMGDPDGQERRIGLRHEGEEVARRLDMQAILRRHQRG